MQKKSHAETQRETNADGIALLCASAALREICPDFPRQPVWTTQIPFENATVPHATMIQNFINAILDGEPLFVPGEEGLNSVELANAMLYSSFLGKIIELPLDAAAWERKLNQLIAESGLEKGAASVSAEDFASSFRR